MRIGRSVLHSSQEEGIVPGCLGWWLKLPQSEPWQLEAAQQYQLDYGCAPQQLTMVQHSNDAVQQRLWEYLAHLFQAADHLDSRDGAGFQCAASVLTQQVDLHS